MITFPVNYNIHELPILGFTLRNIYDALVANLSGSIDETILPAADNPLSGSIDQIGTSFAPMFTGDGWNIWDDKLKVYRPTTPRVGNVSLEASPTQDRLQGIQNKDGRVALLEDAYRIRETLVLREGLVSVDWDKTNSFQCSLGTNRKSAIYMTHSKPGMEIDLLLINDGTAQQVVWDSSIKWPAATAPQPPAAAPGISNAVLVTLRNINGTIYGEYLNYSFKPVTDKGTPTGLISV